jgi:hypothetical protein
MKRSLALLCVCLGTLLLGEITASAQDFVLRESLERNWSNELVTFPLTPQRLAAVKSGAQVVGPEGNAVASQLTDVSGQPRLAFQATLAPGATQNYRLGKADKPATSDIKVEETADRLLLSNAHIGLALRKKLQGDEGPIGGVRLRSGMCTTGSKRMDGAEIASYRVEMTARGPVFAEALCHIEFADQGTWSLRFRVLRDEPVVLVSEMMDVPAGGQVLLPLGSNTFQPTQLLYRRGMGNIGSLESWPIAPGLAYTLEPWLRWWLNDRQGNWFAVYSPSAAPSPGKEGDMLMVGALRASQWRDPEWTGKAEQLAPVIEAQAEQGVVTLHMPLGGGRRTWLLGTPPRDESIAPLQATNRKVAPLPQQYVIKHGDFPLDEVKDYVLDWPGDHDNYPRLFVRKQDLAALRARLPNDPAEVKRWTSQQPIDKYNIEAPLLAYFASQDEALGQAIVKRSNEWLQQVVDDELLAQNGRVTLGVAPHNQSVMLLPTINLTDAALGCPAVTPEMRKRMLARLALLGYVVSRDDYWSPSRGFAANPNMTTTVALYQTAIASLIPSHPRAKQWAERGLTELQRQLRAWSDEDGGWLEAPHYAMVSFDHMLGAFLMASNAGFGDSVHDPQVRKVCEWFAKISTPRDRRTGGFRHYPPIGNTYMGEGTGMFGIVAGLWKDRDPAFAANMQWMCDEHGSPPIGLFGPFGTFSGYKKLLTSHGVAPKAPAYGSQWFRDTGVVLRNHHLSDRETYLHLIAGSQHDHYDFDSGSIVVWGKGRLLADDFGYIGRHPAQWHSLLTSSAVADDDVMQIVSFSPSPKFDYVHGRKGAWQRQIAFAKDADPLGPTGFFLRDSHDAESDATWRLWLTTTGIKIHERGATVEGEDDVDLDIFVFEPATLKLRTEATVQKGMGRRDGKEGPTETSQTALVGTLRGRGIISAFLYPRLKTEPAPKVTWFAGGQGIQIETPAGMDYLFLANPPRQDDDGAALTEVVSADRKLMFQCAAGAVQTRNKSATFTLGASGKIRWGDRVLESPKPAARSFTVP